jgi:hypothetical protein
MMQLMRGFNKGFRVLEGFWVSFYLGFITPLYIN